MPDGEEGTRWILLHALPELGLELRRRHVVDEEVWARAIRHGRGGARHAGQEEDEQEREKKHCRRGNGEDSRHRKSGADALFLKMGLQALWWKRSIARSTVELGVNV